MYAARSARSRRTGREVVNYMAFEKKIDGKTLYEGVIVNVRLDRAELVNGDVVRREVVEHPAGSRSYPWRRTAPSGA